MLDVVEDLLLCPVDGVLWGQVGEECCDDGVDVVGTILYIFGGYSGEGYGGLLILVVPEVIEEDL